MELSMLEQIFYTIEISLILVWAMLFFFIGVQFANI